jgi:hypothetical protein
MLGDDLVDLGDPEARPGASHPGFDARVFAASERAWLAASEAQALARWSLWAAKEAAYKRARRLDPGVRFHPSRFAVALDHDGRCGRVVGPGGEARVRLERSGDALHAVAFGSPEEAERIAHGLATLAEGEDPSLAARALALRRCAERLGARADELRVELCSRIPALHLPDGRALALSLSHHGRFVAFAGALA